MKIIRHLIPLTLSVALLRSYTTARIHNERSPDNQTTLSNEKRLHDTMSNIMTTNGDANASYDDDKLGNYDLKRVISSILNITDSDKDQSDGDDISKTMEESSGFISTLLKLLKKNIDEIDYFKINDIFDSFNAKNIDTKHINNANNDNVETPYASPRFSQKSKHVLGSHANDNATEETVLSNGEKPEFFIITEKDIKETQDKIDKCASVYLSIISPNVINQDKYMGSDGQPLYELGIQNLFANYLDSADFRNDQPLNSSSVDLTEIKNRSIRSEDQNNNKMNLQEYIDLMKEKIKKKFCTSFFVQLNKSALSGNAAAQGLMVQLYNEEKFGEKPKGYYKWVAEVTKDKQGKLFDAISLQAEEELIPIQKPILQRTSFVDSVNVKDVNSSNAIKEPNEQENTDAKNKQTNASVKIKSVNNFNDRESIRIKQFSAKDIKTKHTSFLEISKENKEFLNSEMENNHYALEDDYENAFEDSRPTNLQPEAFKVNKNVNPNTEQLNRGNESNRLNTHISDTPTTFIQKHEINQTTNSSKKGNKTHISRTESPKSNSNTNKNVHVKNSHVKKHITNTNKKNIQKSENLLKGSAQPNNEHNDEHDDEQGDEEDGEEDSEEDGGKEDDGQEDDGQEDDGQEDDGQEDDHADESDDEQDEEKNKSINYSKENSHNKKHRISKNTRNVASTNNKNVKSAKRSNDNDNAEKEENNLIVEHEIDTIEKYRKVYNLNLYNCSLIKDWDFSHQYVEEQGTLVKLSGYVFQNILNSDAMPTSNTNDWKLKGACEFEKYTCGALNFMTNEYSKGERVIFENRVYEALMNTSMSPKDYESVWVDKTNDCDIN